MNIHYDNTSESMKGRTTKARNFTFYLDKIRSKGFEFDRLEAVCTDGDIKPPYPYQWRATTKIPVGWDDPCEGIGGSPLEALRELWNTVKTDYTPYQLEEEPE